jgi:hypothetical protein
MNSEKYSSFTGRQSLSGSTFHSYYLKFLLLKFRPYA